MNRLVLEYGIRRPCSRLRAVVAAIGCTAFPSQLLSSQSPTADATASTATVDAKDDLLTSRLRAIFGGREADLATKWNAAATLGPAATTVLWRLLDGVATADARFTLLAAIQAAGGCAEDDRLLRWADAPGRSARDRHAVAFLLAIGPDRSAPRPDLFVRLRGSSELADLLACLAAARFPGVEGLPTATAAAADADLGRAAAALLAGSPLRESPPKGARHESLFWRGALLGAARRGRGANLRERASALLQERGEAFQSTRQAAAWLLASAGEPTLATTRLDDDVLAVLVGDRLMRARIAPTLATARSPRAGPAPMLAVARVLESPIDAAIATRQEWASGADGRVAVLALAFRIAVGGQRAQAGLPNWPEVPEWAIAQAAAGSGATQFPGVTDAHVARAASAFTRGALPAAAFADALELAAWRAGAHPGLVASSLERDLLRDLVLAGSQEGGGRYQPHVPPQQRYFCNGLGKDDPWFHVAIAFLEWSATPRGPVPAAVRWPRSP